MLVERTREDGRGELLIPSRVIFWVAGILFFLSFLSYDIIDFPGMKKESPTSWLGRDWEACSGRGGTALQEKRDCSRERSEGSENRNYKGPFLEGEL